MGGEEVEEANPPEPSLPDEGEESFGARLKRGFSLATDTDEELLIDSGPVEPVQSGDYGTFDSESRRSSQDPVQLMSLEHRRRLLRSQKRSARDTVSQLNRTGQVGYRYTSFATKVSRKYNSIKQFLRIWGGSIKRIEGNLGSGVVTYFKVLVWLLKINLICLVMSVAFIVGPGIYMETHHGVDDALFNKDDLECTNPDFVNGTDWHERATNAILQFMTGTGWLEATYLFYGWYPTSNMTVEGEGGVEKTTYYFSLAYFSVGCCYFLVSIIFMANNLSKLFKKSAAEAIEKKVYTALVFAGWDFSIQNEETSALNSQRVVKSLQEELMDDAQELAERTALQSVGIFFLRIVTNLICVAAMVGTLYLYRDQILTDTSEDDASATDRCGVFQGEGNGPALNLSDIGQINITEQFRAVWRSYAPSIIVSGSNVVFPIFFQLVGMYEMYQFQSTRIGITLLRMFVMKLFSIAAFLYILYKATGPSGGQMAPWQNADNTLLYNCWEDYIGSQLYQLIMIDFMVFCLCLLLTEVVRGALVTHWSFLRDRVGLGKPEFNIPKEILDLVYKQMILWSGYFFSPLLPLVGVIEVIVIFYLKKHSALANVVPPRTVVLNYQSSSSINALFLISILCVFVFQGLLIFNFRPSAGCGPFRGYERFTDPLVGVLNNSGFIKDYILDNIRMASVTILIIILVCLLIYYFKSLAASRLVTIDLLKEQIRQEKADKNFLVERVHKETGKKKKKGLLGFKKPKGLKSGHVIENPVFED